MPIQLLRKLRSVRRRLQWIEFCRKFLLVVAWLCLPLFVVVVINKLIIVDELLGRPLALVDAFPWVAGIGAVWLVGWVWIRRIKLFDAAVQADQSLGLKERLSSALLIDIPRTEPEKAVVEDATRHAQDVRAGRSFPMNLRREFGWAVVPVAVVLITFFLPFQTNLLAKHEEEKNEKILQLKANKEAAKKLEDLADAIDEASSIRKPEMAKKIDLEIAEIAKKMGEGQLDREDAMAKMDKLKERLKSRQDSLEKKLAMPNNLQDKGQGKMTGEMAKAMERGNFKRAAEALEELKKKLQKGDLSEQEKAALSKELKALALKMGADSKMAEALMSASANLKDGQFNASLADLEDLAAEFADLEAALAELEMLALVDAEMDARLRALAGKPGVCLVCGAGVPLGAGLCAACQGQGTSPWAAGDSRSRGNGMGRAGIGRGGIAGVEEGQIGFEKTKVKGQLTPGQIIAKFKVPGTQLPGDIVTEYETLRMQYEQQAEDTIKNEIMPLQYRSLIREWYDVLKYGDDADESASSENDPGSHEPDPGSHEHDH